MALTENQQKLAKRIGAGVLALAIPLIAHFEGTVPKTYRDPIGIVTACTGHTGPELRMGQAFTVDECSEMLAGDIAIAANGVQDCITEPLTDGELAAYTSFAFNVGVAAFCGSTLARLLKRGDHSGACTELSKWTLAAGKPLPGLVKRRAAERALCEGSI